MVPDPYAQYFDGKVDAFGELPDPFLLRTAAAGDVRFHVYSGKGKGFFMPGLHVLEKIRQQGRVLSPR